MARKANLRHALFLPAFALLGVFASLLTPMQSAFAAGAPTVTGVSPNRGSTAGGTSITITGTGFTGTITVSVGGALATSPIVVNATTATATTPVGTAGATNVVLTRTSDSKSGTGTGLFTYGYTVTYNANSATSGTVPSDTTVYNASQNVTVLGNTGSLARVNYAFANWNTAANGSGTSYSGGNTFAIAANTTLYAQWTPTYTVVYNGNTNTGGTVPTDTSSPYVSGGTVTVLSNTGSLVKTGSTFNNWNTAANGSGTSYAPSNTFSIGSNTVLYAQWRATLTYGANGADGGTVPVDASSPYRTGTTVTVLGNTGSLVKTGSIFDGWNTVDDGSGITYHPSNTFTINATTVLYALWASNAYAVTYNSNGATSGSSPVDAESPFVGGSSVTIVANSGNLVKSDYAFSGWNTAIDGSGTTFDASGSDTFTIASDTTFYSLWLRNHSVTFNSNGGLGSMSIQISAAPTGLSLSAFTRVGYLFSGWNTASNRTGNAYADGATFSFAGDITLYAQWTLQVQPSS